MLILNLQFWANDRPQAMALARLIADIEPVKRTDVTFLFTARFDCKQDAETVEYVSKKFNVKLHTSRRTGTGWPHGCNDLFADSYAYCIEKIREGEINAEAILFMEADCVPLDMNWINHLIYEYKNCGKMVLGCWLMAGDCGTTHINGNCIIHKDFWKTHRNILNPGPGAWDGENPGPIMGQGAASRLIFSDYHLGTDRNPWHGNCVELWKTRRFNASDNPLYGQNINPVWLHGPKTTRAIDCVRERFFGRPLMAKREFLGGILNQLNLVGEGIEIGVFRGENAEQILKTWNGKMLYLLDPWVTQKDYVDRTNEADFDDALRQTKNRMQPFEGRHSIIRETSEWANKHTDAIFPFGLTGLDFAYLDAKHDYESAKRDLQIWWPRIKSGGIIAGHDYKQDIRPGVFICEVKRAVDEFFGPMGLRIHSTTDDDVPSWLVCKP